MSRPEIGDRKGLGPICSLEWLGQRLLAGNEDDYLEGKQEYETRTCPNVI